MGLYKKGHRSAPTRSGLTRRLANGGLLALLIGVSYSHADLIVASFTSLVLSPLSLVLSPGHFGRLHLEPILEYWIAAIVWLYAVVLLLYGIIRPSMKQAATRIGVLGRILSYARERRRSMEIGIQAILFTAFVGAAAPFLTLWDPGTQGALPNTRLLPPLSRVFYVEYLPTVKTVKDGTIAAKLAETNNYLMNRSIKFSALQGQVNLAQPSAQIVGHGERLLILGSDHLGRDLLSRLIYGTRVSLGIALLAALSAIAVGAFFGLMAGLAGGMIERLLMRLLDVLLAIPSLFFILAVMSFFGTNVLVMTGVLIALGWMTPARIVRTEVVSLREREFVLSARLLGVPMPRIILVHILPNMFHVLLTSFLLLFSNMVLAEATLSFLGLGVQPPTPSWGSIIGEATNYLHAAWWIGFFPGIAISSLILCAHVVVKGWEENYGS